MNKLSRVEGVITFLVLTAFCGGVAFFLAKENKPQVEYKTVPLTEPLVWKSDGDADKEDESLYLLPPLKSDFSLPIPDAVEPHLDWPTVNEALTYLNLTKRLGAGDKQVMAVGNTYKLIVSNSKLSATTFYNRWIQSAKREGLSVKNKVFWVTVVGDNSIVEKTHHCTTSGAH